MILDPRVTDPAAAAVAAALLAAHPTVHDVAAARAVPWPRDPDRADVPTHDTALAGRPARVYRPAVGWTGTVLFLHGGGWVIGDLDINDGLCRDLAVAAGAQLVSLDYRLAPEHPFPAGLEDAAAALSALAGGAVDADPERLAVAGHSAGGNLAAALARRGPDGTAPAVRHQVLLCPVLDADLTRPSYQECTADLPLTAADMAWYWDRYLPDVDARRDPDASPLRVADAAGLPPATVVAADIDPLRDEAVRYAAHLRDAEVPVTLLVEPGVPHLYLTFPSMPSRDRGVALAGTALRAALG